MFIGKQNVLAALKAIIGIRYGYQPRHYQTVVVHEALDQSKIIWDGEVEVFRLKIPGGTVMCFAWMHSDPEGVQVVTVLENELVNSPQQAVRSAVFFDARSPNAPCFRVWENLPFIKELQIAIENQRRRMEQFGHRVRTGLFGSTRRMRKRKVVPSG
jgi:hypothetical protein